MAFKQLYECEFCGKTKYFFPEQAIDAKCECEEINIDLNNTWCEANKENEKYLYENVSKNTHNLNKEKYFIIEKTHHKLDVRTINYTPNSNYKKIHLVNGKFEFVKSKHKNNFKDYGFEADFEGEIKFIDSFAHYVGICEWHEEMPTKTQNKQTVYWINYKCYLITSNGVIRIPSRDLKPIKKEWYETPDNFPCIVIYEEKEIKLMRSYSETSKHRKEPCLLTSDGGVYHSLDKCRPATKEEILSLLVK